MKLNLICIFTLAVPGVNYIPLFQNITFMPNDTVICVNLTILADYKSAVEKTLLAMFISTQDSSIHLKRNMTIVSIESRCKFWLT